MKKNIFNILAILLFASNSFLFSQVKITVQDGDNATFYSSLDTAITYAPNNSTIYVPGGNFTITVPINKPLKIFGVGHYPDSVNYARGRTVINGNIYLAH